MKLTCSLCSFQDYRYLELLSALCVCNGVALTENQRYITECWLLNEVKVTIWKGKNDGCYTLIYSQS